MTAVHQLQRYESMFEQSRRHQEIFRQDKIDKTLDEKIQTIGGELEAELVVITRKVKQYKQLLAPKTKKKIMFK